MPEFKNISILHISDLHKDDGDDFKNLFQSMVDDCERYVRQGVMKPNVIVVSGDLIRGGTTEEIKKQYQEVYAFLNDLVSFFLNGDKSRIVIVPGNHDVDWNVSKAHFTPIAQETDKEKEAYKRMLMLYLREKAPKIRWNWADQQLYKYADEDVYNSRFLLFSEFYQTFYGDRTFSLRPCEQFDIFDIPGLNLCFVGLNSCHLNDHLNKVGQINPTCVTKVGGMLKEKGKQGRILVAVWHHNASGRPMVNNYLDNRILNPIIDMGVHIALHGHQHYSGVVEEYHNAFKDGKLLMFSTGSLYGASETLSYGAPRQYNILEMRKDADELILTVHLRQDNNSHEYGIPSWGEGNIKEIAQPSWQVSVPYPKQPIDEERLSELLCEGMETGDYQNAIDMLKRVASEDETMRKTLLDLMYKNKNYREIVDYIGDPTSAFDARILIQAVFELGDKELAGKVRNLNSIKNSNDPQVRKMKDYL